ncbi:GPW/gp25 family protein [Nocardia brasiliensis]|uniref:GPW/gp25 family protein n=1 Tax=Nocardia brasiliensis TaxID=37326 RepID=UPI0024548378|nr:GPW/gp25 family protein [Nocardia brasiliensis]
MTEFATGEKSPTPITDEVIGRGWRFPARINAGRVMLADGVEEIEQAIHLVLATAVGERPLRPEFGSRLHEFVFAELDAATAGQIGYEVRAALERWEPRITIDDVIVEVAADLDRPAFYIDVQYRIASTNSDRNLVFPFYIIPDERPGSPGR